MDRDALDDLRAFSPDGGEFETADLLELLHDVSELGRKVVVNEKNLHRHAPDAFPKAATDMCAEIRSWDWPGVHVSGAIRPTAR